MNDHHKPMNTAGNREADDLAATVSAGASVFEAIRAAAESRADAGDEVFAAAMLTAAEAADGRDALTSAPSWQPAMMAVAAATTVRCEDIASIAATLASALRDAAARSSHPDDMIACERAAGCADGIRDLMTGDTS